MKLPATLLIISTLFSASLNADTDSWYFELTSASGARSELQGRGGALIKIWIKGNKYRWENHYSPYAAEIRIDDGTYSYQVQPYSKTVFKSRSLSANRTYYEINPWQLGKRAATGGKKSGSEQVGNDICDIYTQEVIDQVRSVRVWVRRSDGIALRSEARGDGDHVWIKEYKNFKRGINIADSVFQPPKDYKIDDRGVIPRVTDKAKLPKPAKSMPPNQGKGVRY